MRNLDLWNEPPTDISPVLEQLIILVEKPRWNSNGNVGPVAVYLLVADLVKSDMHKIRTVISRSKQLAKELIAIYSSKRYPSVWCFQIEGWKTFPGTQESELPVD